MRQIVLDTETTGLSHQAGHRVIEIGAVELINRRLTGKQFHYYLNPDRDIDAGAQQVHGITRKFLADKPRFKEVSDAFIEFIRGSELIIHNATFDVGFLNYELSLVNKILGGIEDYASVLDTLPMARKKHPGQKNSLDALCKRYSINNFERNLHGALLDARILAEIYLVMTGGQEDLSLEVHQASTATINPDQALNILPQTFQVIAANAEELAEHEQYLQKIRQANSGTCIWLQD